MAYDAGTAEALRVIEQALSDTAAKGRVQIEVHYSDAVAAWMIDLTPANSHACPVSVVVGTSPQVDVFLGIDPTKASLELWGDDRGLNLARLRELLTAVVEGRYEQTIKTFKRDRIRVEGRFHLPTGEEAHTHTRRVRQQQSSLVRRTCCGSSGTRAVDVRQGESPLTRLTHYQRLSVGLPATATGELG